MKFGTAMLMGLALVIGSGIAGCKKKTESEKTGGGPKKSGDDLHTKGPHGGFIAEPQKHAFRVEIVFNKEGKTLEFFLFEHDENKPLLATNETILLTDLKNEEKKKLADITLKKAPLKGETDGSSHFKAEGDAVKELEEDHDLNGARFKVTVKGKEEKQVTIKRHHEHDE